MRKPRALKPGDRIAVVAPASAFARAEFDAGVAELRALGFEPVYEESVFERRAMRPGSATTRAAAFARAWRDPAIAALIAVRGGYGSVHLLPLLGESLLLGQPKAFIGYSDNTSLLVMADTDAAALSRSTGRCSRAGSLAGEAGTIERRFSVVCAGRNRRTKSAIRRSRCFIRAKPPGCSSEER